MGVHMLKREGAVFQTREEAEEADHARWESVLPTSSNLSCTELNSLTCVWRYNEKQARIAERRRLNFEKKLAVRGNNLLPDLTCLYAGGIQMPHRGELRWDFSFPSRAGRTHQGSQGGVEEALDMPLRHIQVRLLSLVCLLTWFLGLSRTAICGKKFRSRREFNEHSEEHAIAFKAKTVSG